MTPASAVPPAVELTHWDREPTQTPGYVQPHGVLLVLSEPGLVITHASASAAEWLHAPPAQLLGQRLDALVGAAELDRLAPLLRQAAPRTAPPLPVTVAGRTFDLLAHRHGGRLLLELEPAPERQTVGAVLFHAEARGSIARLRGSKDLTELCANAAHEVRRLTGFDRVLVYVFDEHWNGRVIAEEKRADVASYLGLHFPASDIPKQARELYRLNPLRLIPNVAHAPSPIVAQDASAPPLDLSFSLLRAVSPIHLEYLRNMKATASMSVSLFRGERLWGLISCTHEAGPRQVPYEARSVCELIAEVTSSLLDAKEANEDRDYKIRLQQVQTALLQSMALERDFVRGLIEHRPSLLDVTTADGAAVYFNQRLYVTGRAPADAELEGLIDWLSHQAHEGLFVTDSLPSHYPPAQSFRDVACGLVAGPLSRGQHNYVLWFRPEVTQTVHWGGNPNNAVEAAGEPSGLHPRTSFELWKETVHLKSLPWKPAECEAAAELMKSIVDLVLQKSEALARLNSELERSNVELDAFAYAASHDLKEPLRGIHNYTRLAMRELGDAHLVGESRARLNTVVKLTERMEDLINSLLHYSHVGRTDLSLRDVDLNGVVRTVAEMIKARLDDTHTELRIPRPLPTVRGDRVLLGEVFSNLLTNALKYNDKPERWIEVSHREATTDTPLVLSVKDNGIGIREKNLETIFKIFRRLHGREKFGGGTGTGLTITRRIIERHGGSIWVSSTYGEGTTVSFTLEEGAGRAR
jgi:light-regulated signal transduction histidine kinase (bacteriophytochrome)